MGKKNTKSQFSLFM
ncbi:hypothetical protein OIU79_024449 [Salix purpurea]|uniref:Uncharacterized protein n=1 Tax=Salix purpurea TaxID=77065 RepID=A0A9Q0WDT6_SALPP|nr:hypothetical protein OIU79_024449 [Salix purpurea]